MADAQEPSIPVALEQSEISTNLNANILYTFLMGKYDIIIPHPWHDFYTPGIYTAVYFGTLYLYSKS